MSGIPFGRYVLKQRIARGGMGEVFRAIAVGASGFAKPVVVKRILPQLVDREQLAAMFVEEAMLMCRLNHPNIVQVIDFGQGEQDDYFLVLELVDGVDLEGLRRSYQDRGADIPLSLALYVAIQILRGLGFAHGKALDDGRCLVHRDVSPANVLLSKVGEVKVADFGVALVAQPGLQGENKRLLVGKPRYMAPEQYAGESIDGRADLFSVGVVLFELLTGQSPFSGDDDDARQARARAGRVRSATELRPELTTEVAEILTKALAAKPQARFTSARQMADRLESLRAGGVTIGTADELAEVVESLAGERDQQAKPVIALSGQGPADDWTGKELTRAGVQGEFTVRVPAPEATATLLEVDGASGVQVKKKSGESHSGRMVHPDSFGVEREAARHSVPVPAASGPAKGRRRTPAGTLIGGSVIIASLVGGYFLMNQPEQPAGSAPSTTVQATGSVPSGSTVTDPRSNPSIASSTEPKATSASAKSSSPGSPPPEVAAIGTWAKPPPSGTVTDKSTSSVSARSTAPPVACQGQLLLFAKHGWLVSGGPSAVQAPGRYTWPCGSYPLIATSRIPGDNSRRQLTAVIRDGAPTTIDLR